jgi:hypothetical protein
MEPKADRTQVVLMPPLSSRYGRTSLLVLGALLLAVGSSRQRKGDDQSMGSSQSAQKDECKLVVESRLESENALVLHYTFQNNTNQQVYLFNRLYKEIEQGPLFDTDPNLVNIEILPKGLLISKKIVPVPPDVDVEKPLLPCSSLVKPGDRLSETIRLSLPLSAWTPYLDHPGEPPSQVIRRKAWFEVGYFVSSAASQSLAQPVRTKQGDAFYFDPFPIAGQKTLEAELPLEIPIHSLAPR